MIFNTRYKNLCHTSFECKRKRSYQCDPYTPAGNKNPVQVSADILRALGQRAEKSTLGGDLTGVVITVPAYFDDAQRAGTKDAAQPSWS